MKRRISVAVSIVVVLLLCSWLWYSNFTVELSEYEVAADIPSAFDGFTIIQLSDLHNAQLGENNKNVLEVVKSVETDIIVMTGDMIDSRNTEVDVALDFAKEAVKIAPCYFVAGNHEARVNLRGDEYTAFKAGLIALGVTVLESESCIIKNGEDTISITGINDTGFDMSIGVDYLLKEALSKEDNYKILLAHRPEYFDLYDGADMIFSGHAHGGQVRLPFVGGLFAPGQGILPEYDGGVYTEDGKVMVVSRGLGNSLFPVRINNKPEVVAVKLKAK